MKYEKPTIEVLLEIVLDTYEKPRRLVMVDAAEPDALAVEVEDKASTEEILESAKVALRQRFWFVDPRWNNERLVERFQIRLDAHATEIFVFGEMIDQKTRDGIKQTLERMYNALIDKTLWTLESIQILSHATINQKNGAPFRGTEFPAQRRFELYPEGMNSSAYRSGELRCSELEGTIIHEATHIVLEEILRPRWETNELGWKTDESILIELPGGAKTITYNERPQECPTSYAALQSDDDRADSVAAFLFDREKLHPTRRKILEHVFIDPKFYVTATIEHMSPKLPKLPDALPVAISERKKNIFGLTTIRPGKNRDIITLSDFRKMRGILEPVF
jgi:hypothetical protein